MHVHTCSMNRIRVVTYNLLSDSLARPTHFQVTDRRVLHKDTRWKKILRILDKEVDHGSIICLQEVSRCWGGKLHCYFQNKGYHFVTSHYGRKFNGYMGCGIAFQNSAFSLRKAFIDKIGDRLPQKSTTEEEWPIWTNIKAYVGHLLWTKTEDVWEYARQRSNTLITVCLRQISSESELFVATYHMPCVYWLPQVMTIHSVECIRRAQNLANGCPLIVAGDFNLLPSSTQYGLITGRSSGRKEEDIPPLEGLTWSPDLTSCMKSAYAEVDGSEPDFTNHALLIGKPVFQECIDYIFYDAKGVKPVKVAKLNNKEDSTPMPNNDEPSDHLLLAADFELTA